MSATMTATRTITGRHPVTGEAIPVTLAWDEWVVGYHLDGTPLVRRATGRPGSTFAVSYVCDALPYSDIEAFDPLGIGNF